MAQHEVIILKDNKHTPAEAGDTIDHKLLPISAQQGNSLESKDDGLFVAAGTSNGNSGLGEIISLTPIEFTPFDGRGSWYALKHRKASGDEETLKFPAGYPMKIHYQPRAGGGGSRPVSGIAHNYLQEQYQNQENDYNPTANVLLATPVLNTPTVEGTKLKLSIAFHLGGTYGNKIANSDQGVEVDLAEVLGTKLAETQDIPNGTTGSDVPTAFIGAAREKLLAAPDKWLEVTINGERGVIPWFKLR